MVKAFISYSSEDREFALSLAERLEMFFDVWIDREGISGGTQWEQAIEDALKNCGVFIVVVSPQSNQSEWVTRETLRAEELKKYRVPVLLDGNLPLRLLDLHYIDFRGDFEGGILDLIEILNQHISPEQVKEENVNSLLGAGIRAYLAQQYTKANNLISQAIALEPDLGDTLEGFWKKMRETQEKGLANDLMQEISILEWHQEVPLPEDNPRYGQIYDWSIEIDAPDEVLDMIDFVQYQLHHTFQQPNQIVRNREDNFRLVRRGWAFRIPVTIQFKDGTSGELKHGLTFGVI